MKRILVIAPHPDDEAIGLGGTLRTHVVAGDHVRVVFLTSGEAGGHGIEDAGGKREQEAERAAEILGIDEHEFWRFPDGSLRATERLVERLRALLESAAPDVVYAPHAAEEHSDHRAAARALHQALNRSAFCADVRQYELWTPLSRMNVIIDITHHLEAKLAAVRAYESQCSILRFDDAFTGLARYRGEMFNWPERGYAEVFLTLRRSSSPDLS